MNSKRMIRLILFFAMVIGLTQVNAQNPVSWNFTTKKVDGKTFELHLTATMQSGWHLYSQLQPDDAVVIPTGITFNNNPLFKLEGKTREIGKLEKFKDDQLGISANQYSKKVEFIQTIKLKGKAITNISGKVEYQTCDDKKCLPPKTVNFSIALK